MRPQTKENGRTEPICGVLRLFCGTQPQHTHVVGSGLHCLGFRPPVNDAPCYAHSHRALICALVYRTEPLRLMTRGSFNTETPLPAATRKFRCHFRFKSPLHGIQSIWRFICCCFATKASLSAATALSLRAFVDHLVSTHHFAQRSLCLGARLLTFFQFSNIPNDAPHPKKRALSLLISPQCNKEPLSDLPEGHQASHSSTPRTKWLPPSPAQRRHPHRPHTLRSTAQAA